MLMGSFNRGINNKLISHPEFSSMQESAAHMFLTRSHDDKRKGIHKIRKKYFELFGCAHLLGGGQGVFKEKGVCVMISLLIS